VLQLSFPDNVTSLAGTDLATSGEALHAVAFTVRDLNAAVDFLTSKGLLIADRDDETVLVDPTTSFGAPFRFTTLRLEGDPRDSVRASSSPTG
jgi:catechol 2,3-dioxygenase-like lactoylglutathione lyase family enzyme